MPLGFQRLNERQQRPNANINFIKPIDGPDKAVAQDFLERIAAQCSPIMQKDYISVMALEEYPPNPEFLGRNFNAGEVIQLVLKDKQGRWLSFKFVQMVMMHELAHCKQMNHSRSFWTQRNEYAKQMEDLWARRYTGEGLWGRGQDLQNGRYVHDHMPADAQIPEHLCGGTYRRARGRKRKRGQDQRDERPKETYAERQQKRIARKFGKHGEGNALGEDDLVRGGLEHGRRHYGKPKVANSKRGRELRASAALARFEQASKNIKQETPELVDDDDNTTESDDWYSDEDVISSGAIPRTKGKTIKDGQGHDLVKVCSDEGEEDQSAQDEMADLHLLSSQAKGDDVQITKAERATPGRVGSESIVPATEDSETESEPDDTEPKIPSVEAKDRNSNVADQGLDTHEPVPAAAATTPTLTTTMSVATTEDTNVDAASSLHPNTKACPICSLENKLDSSTCIACSHVLRTSLMPNHWRCGSEACKGSKYINAGDFGRCGLCGAQKPAVTATKDSDGRALGLIGADVLRWD